MAEWTKIQTPLKESELKYWIIYFGGSLQLQGAGEGIQGSWGLNACHQLGPQGVVMFG
jgi:hypothetical protein